MRNCRAGAGEGAGAVAAQNGEVEGRAKPQPFVKGG